MPREIEIDAQLLRNPADFRAAEVRSLTGRGVEPTPADLHRLATRLLEVGTRAVACEQGLAVRTLLRRLAQRGTTARTLIQRLRRERALRLLATTMPLKDVARALELSGPISLARFCRREFGTTAARLREDVLRRETISRIRCLRCGTKC